AHHEIRLGSIELESVGPRNIGMSLINGESLEDELAARAGDDRFFRWPELMRFAGQISGAIDYAHQRGVIHRDLKPSNIMLDDTHSPPEIRILDFGIAKLASGSARNPTTQGRVMGTGFYMAPEQARGDKIDARADLFAFGVLLFEMVTLRRAWVRNDRGGPVRAFAEPARRNEFNTPTAILSRIAHETRPRPSDFRKGLNEALDKVIMSALAIDPSDRPQNATSLFLALQDAVQGILLANPAVSTPTLPDTTGPIQWRVDATWSRSPAVANELTGMERSGPTLALPQESEAQVTQVATDASIPVIAALQSGIGARDPTIEMPPAAAGASSGVWSDDGTVVQEEVVDDGTVVQEDAVMAEPT
ncbi:MAG: serine/threonine-protein kinase, partial [Myxococcota bacterium]